MKKIVNTLYSTRLMAILFILFAAAMGIATFIENDFGTQTAKKLVYNAWWFELIMVFFVINFFGNMFRYKLFRKEKWTVLLFHLAFLFIIIGAGITRYISYEGMMILDEGETSNKFLSETNYLNVIVDNNKFQKTTANELLLSAWGKNSASFSEVFQPSKDEEAKNISFKLIDYIPWSEKKFIEDDTKPKHLLLVESSSGSRHEHHIKQGTIQNIHNILVGFDAENNNASINIKSSGDSLTIRTKQDGDFMIMANQSKGLVYKDSLQKFNLRSLYNVSGLPFVVPQFPINGEVKIVRGKKSKEKYDTVIFDVTVDGKTERIELTGGQFNTSGKKEFSIGDLNFRAWYGAKQMKLPFNLKLNDFQLEKYPGSEAAASFASEVTVIDPKETFDFRIFMNHILDYRGYKFFQSSYKNAGKKIEQTHLSVNHDFWGTLFTYIGYSMLYIGLFSMLFSKGTRFTQLKKGLKKLQNSKALLLILCVSISSFIYGQEKPHSNSQITEKQIDSILKADIVDVKHAEQFSKIVIQDAGGRMKPAHTFASELVRKVAHTENFRGMSPSQILLSITEKPGLWTQIPFVYLNPKDPKIKEVLGLPKNTKYAKLIDFYDAKINSKIGSYVAEAQKKKIKSEFDKDVIKTEKRVWLLSQALSGGILKIFPIQNDENNKWISHPEIPQANFRGEDAIMIPRLLPLYFQSLQSARKSNDYSKVNQVLEGIKNFQKTRGTNVYPSQHKIDLEIKYNKWNLFNRVFVPYILLGILLVLLMVFKIFYENSKLLNWLIKITIGLILLCFAAHTAGLIFRWIISGHAPWTNAYEALIYVAWATMLFGLFFGRKSGLAIGAASFIVGFIMLFANQHWLDPEIANLQPVLNSWWILVHVSIIVASYGPFSLGMILGVLSLILMVFTTSKNQKKVKQNIKELTIINEMTSVVGLVLLTVGTFLGGMWANESWGRYWGWDPKETWALIAVMIYAFVLHMRLIPGLKGTYKFNLASVIAYYAILMAFMGVNFYLSGLHSYASGDRVITPASVYYSIAFVAILGTLAGIQYRKFYKK